MGAVLRHIILQNRIFNFIMSPNTTPMARVRTLSNTFPIHDGTRQGCRLLPIRFVLTLEPLLCRLRATPDIKGIPVAELSYKLTAFADDILLFLKEALETIPNLLKDFELFQCLSNLKINFAKSHELNISLPEEVVTQCQNNFPFHWQPDTIKYFGIQLTAHLLHLYTKCYVPILRSISDLCRGDRSSFSWIGFTAILNMNILPYVLYILQMIPIKLPIIFFQTYNEYV